MIIWLASYPKSGNTWVRLFLNQLLFKKDNNEFDINNINLRQFPLKYDFDGLSKNINDPEEFVKNCIPSQEKINLSNKINFFKTHNALWKNKNFQFTNEENTLGVIHIVRDPRNIITSLINHYNFENYGRALEFMKNPKQYIGLSGNQNNNDLITIISSWNNHYNSWKKFKKNNLLIKYENLILNTEDEFFKICKFINNISNIKFETDNIKNSIQNCNFENLKKIETTSGFVESTINKTGGRNKFFNLGPKNNWEKILKKEIVKELESSFFSEMKELNYL